MLGFCHRDYFRHFRLNVEQYGEILIAQAFRGIKMGDEQVGYDVKVAKSDFISVLRTPGLCLPDEDLRIEVKSKLSPTSKGGKAEVINLRETKITGCERRRQLGMTHLAVVLVRPGSRAKRANDEEGRIAEAWLLPRAEVIAMRDNTTRKGRSLSVREIIASIARNRDSILDIKPLLELAADAPLLEMLAEARSEFAEPAAGATRSR
jgi:hypothetical protein